MALRRQDVLAKWWRSTIDDFGAAGSNGLTKLHYKALHASLYTILLGIPVDHGTFETDWAADSEGTDEVKQNQFEKGIYQMIDQWCTTTDKEERVQLLEAYHDKMFSEGGVRNKQHIEGSNISASEAPHEASAEELAQYFGERTVSKQEWGQSCAEMAKLGAKLSQRKITEEEVRESEDLAKRGAEAQAKTGSIVRTQSETEERARREAEERTTREAEELEVRAAKKQLAAASNAAASNPIAQLREAEERWCMATAEIEQRASEQRGRREAREREQREKEERRRREVDEEVAGGLSEQANTILALRSTRNTETALQMEKEERMQMWHEELISRAGGEPNGAYWKGELTRAQETMKQSVESHRQTCGNMEQTKQDTPGAGKRAAERGSNGRTSDRAPQPAVVVVEYVSAGTQTMRSDVAGVEVKEWAGVKKGGASKEVKPAGLVAAEKTATDHVGREATTVAALFLGDRDRHLDRASLSRPPPLMRIGRGPEKWVPVIPPPPPPTDRVGAENITIAKHGCTANSAKFKLPPNDVAAKQCSHLNFDFYDLRVVRPVSGGGPSCPPTRVSTSTSTTALEASNEVVRSGRGSVPAAAPIRTTRSHKRVHAAQRGGGRLDADAVLRRLQRQQRKRGAQLPGIHRHGHAAVETEAHLAHATPLTEAVRHRHYTVPTRPHLYADQPRTLNRGNRGTSRLARPKHVHGAAKAWKHKKRVLLGALAPPPAHVTTPRLR
jgi:hypothetical protein